MTERERKILMGESIEPRTADENAYANVSGGGSGGGVLVCTVNDNDELDKTMGEIQAAVDAGKLVWNDTGEETGRFLLAVITYVHEEKGRFLGLLEFPGDGTYSVSEETEEAALNSYPTRE